MDSHDRPPVGVRTARSVATLVLVGGQSQAVYLAGGEVLCAQSDQIISRFLAASEAVAAAVEAVASGSAGGYAAVTTGEFAVADTESMIARVRAIAGFAQPGQVVVSLATQELARLALPVEYGFSAIGSTHVQNREARPGRVERLFLAEHASLPLRAIRLRSAVDMRRNTAFFGRRRDLEELSSLIDLSRLVTLTGITGIGKSALLHRFVADIGDRFPDGVAHIDLSLVDQPSLVAPTLVRIVDAAKLPGEDHIEALIAHLGSRRFLLVVDNVEHLLPEVQRILIPLVNACPELAVLVGSQRPLRIAGEARYQLRGLETSISGDNWRAMQDCDAIALFIDRAQLLDPAYRLSERDAPSIAEICRRLDGCPLAIEFAAAKTPAFSPRQLLTRLDDRLSLLHDRSSSRPERHRSLKSTVDWSRARLSADAKELMCRLAVFAGGFSTDEAVKVCVDGTMSEIRLLDAIEELLDGSLLVPIDSTGSEKRFRMTETVRIYATQELRGSVEGTRLEARYREWCARLCEEAGRGLNGPDQFEWLERLDAHYEDVRTVIEHHCLPGGDGAAAVTMLLSIHSYFFARHYLLEGFKLAGKVVDSRNTQSAAEMPRVQNLVSVLAGLLGDLETAREYALRSIAGARRQNDQSLVARARASLAFCYIELERHELARRHLNFACDTFRMIGEELPLIRALINLSTVEPYLGLTSQARSHLAEAGQMLPRYPDPLLRAYFDQNIGHVELTDGNPIGALRNAKAAALTFDRTEDFNALSTSLRNAAYALEMVGELQLAARFVGLNRVRMRALDQRLKSFEFASLQALVERLRTSLGDHTFEMCLFIGGESSVGELFETVPGYHVKST